MVNINRVSTFCCCSAADKSKEPRFETKIFFGPESDHCLTLSLTNWLTDSVPFSRLDWCYPGVLRFLLLLMLMLRIVLVTVCWRFASWGFGHKAKPLFKLWAQGLVKALRLELRQDFEAEVWLVFWCWCFVEVARLNLGQYSEARFGQDFNFRFSWDADVWLRFWS